jgi:hypothetical protein
MIVHLTSEQEAHLGQIAEQRGKNTEQLLIDAALHLFGDDLETQRILDERVLAADRGVFIEQAEMDTRVQAMLSGG